MKQSILNSNRRRIFSNYLRLFLGLAVGLLVTRLLLDAGKDVFAIYTLVTVGMGVSVMLTELLRMGFVPELGKYVLNGTVEDTDAFRGGLTASFAISFCSALLGALIMAILAYFMLQHIEPDDLRSAAWIFLWMRIGMMLVIVTLTPIATILLISDRQPYFNLLLFLERMAELVAVSLPLIFISNIVFPQEDYLILIGFIVCALTALTHVSAAILTLKLDANFLPKAVLPTRSSIWKILNSLGWSSLQTVSMNLYARGDILIASAFLGTTGIAALGIALRLMGYVRQGTTGLINGLDATFANLQGKRRRSTGKDLADDGGRQIISISSALQASVIFPTAAIMILTGPEIIKLWIGDALSNSSNGSSVQDVAQLSSLMVIGVGIRSLTLGWMSAMTGSGIARYFTPWLVPGAIINILFLVGWAYTSPESFSILVVGWAFLILQAITHGLFLPAVTSRALNISLGQLFIPFLMPAVFTVSALSLFLLWKNVSVDPTDTVRVLVAFLLFSSASLASLLFSLTRGYDQ
jgi:hypothetical protein